MSEIPEVEAREEALRRMLAGQSSDATADEASAGVDAAQADRERDDSGGIFGPRDLGFSYITELDPGPDDERLLFAVTDGERQAAIEVRLTGSLVATLGDEDPIAHALERLRGAAGTLPNDGRRYENVVLHHPLGLSS